MRQPGASAVTKGTTKSKLSVATTAQTKKKTANKNYVPPNFVCGLSMEPLYERDPAKPKRGKWCAFHHWSKFVTKKPNN